MAKKIPTNGARRAGAVHSPQRVEDFLAEEFIKLARKWNTAVRKIILPRIKDFAKQPKDQRTDAKGSGVSVLRQAMRAAASRTFSQQAIRSVTESAARRVDSYSKDVFRRLGIDPKKEPTMRALISGWSRDQAERVKGLANDQIIRLSSILEGAGNREASYVAKDIQAQLGVSESRAEFIARDSIQTLNASIARERMSAAEVEEYVWTSMRDGRVRERHVELDGEIFDVDGEGDSEEGHPGEPPNCFPGSTPILHTNLIERAWRFWYSGETTSLVVSSGETIEATPNHPVLTARGWVPIKSLDVGDYVFHVEKQAIARSKQHNHDRQPTIAEVFNTLAMVWKRTRIASSKLQFHGDGSVNQEVDVVEVDGGLLNHVKPSTLQLLGEFVFSESFVQPQPLPEFGSLTFGLEGIGLPATRIVSRFGQHLSFLARRLGHAAEHCFAPIATRNIDAIEEIGNRLAFDPIAFSEGLDRGTLPVQTHTLLLRIWFGVLCRTILAERSEAATSESLGEIVRRANQRLGDLSEQHPLFEHPLRVIEKRVGVFEGHVYDLQTNTGWYATRLLNSNCRCVAFPLKVEKPKEDDEEGE